jgi:hypothetical protein
MCRSVVLTVIATLSLALLITLGIPAQATAQSGSPATPSSAPASKQTGEAALASAPNFSAAGITTKVVSISKSGSYVALALMFQNTNPYPVRSALVAGSFTLVDNKGQFMRAQTVSGMQTCGAGRSLEQYAASCLEPKNLKDSAYLEIDAGASVVVNMSLGGSHPPGDTVTLSGMLAVLPAGEETQLSDKQGKPSKGRVINISIPLIPLQ